MHASKRQALQGLCCASLVGALALAGCRARPRGPVASEVPAEDMALLSTDEMGEQAFLVRQRIQAIAPDGKRHEFQAVVQYQAGELTVLVLTPYGSRALTIVQRGETLEIETFGSEKMPFDPRRLLIDVHQVFFVRASDSQRRVEYSGEGRILPLHVELDHLEFGYRLVIENFEQREL